MSKLRFFLKKHEFLLAETGIVIIAAILFLFFQRNAINTLKINFENDSSIRINQIYKNMETGVVQLAMLDAFFEGSDFVSEEEFRTFSTHLMKDNAIDALTFSVFGRSTASVSELYPLERGALFKVRPFDENNGFGVNGYDTCAVIYAEPPEPYRPVRGMNLLTEKTRSMAIDTCIKNKSVIASSPVDIIVLKDGENSGFILFSPVSLKNSKGKIAGVAAAVFSVKTLVTKSIEPTPPLNIYTDFYDVTNGNEELLYKWQPRVPDSAAGKVMFMPFYPKNIENRVYKEIAGRKWLIVTHPGKVYLKRHFSMTFLIFIPLCIVFLGLLFYYGGSMRKRVVEAEKIADEKGASLEEKSRELLMFFETTIDLFCIANLNGYFIKLNKEWEKTLGYSLDELEGTKFINFVHADDKEATLATLSGLGQGRSILNFVNRYRHKNGSYRWIEWRSSMKNGLVYAAARDITDRMKSEELLRDNEAKFRALFLAIPDPTVLNRAVDGSYVMVNDRYLRMSGYTREEVLSSNSKDLKIWADYDDRQKVMDELKKSNYLNNVQVRFRMKDGAVRNCLVSGSVIMFNEEPHILLTARDITDRLEIEDRLKKQEFWLRESQRAGRIGSFEIDITAKNWICTRVLDEIFGITADFVKSLKNWNALIYDEDKKMMENYYGEITKKMAQFNREYRIKRPLDGSIRWVHGRGDFSFNEAGKPVKLIGTIQDITERKNAELALKDSEEKFKTAFVTSPDVIAINRARDGMYVLVNDGFLRTTGYTKDEIIGKTSKEIAIWDDYADRDKLVEMLKEKGYVTGYQFKFRVKDGKSKTCLMSANIIMLNNEPHIMVNVKDISDRILFEEQLKEHEFWLRESQKAANVGSYDLNIKTGIWKSTKALDDIFGIDDSYVKNMDGWAGLINSAQRDEMKKYVSEIVKNKAVFDREYRIERAKDKSERWVYGRGKIVAGADGSPERMIGTITDVTELHEKNLKIIESQEKLHVLFESMTEGVAQHEYVFERGRIVNYRIVDANKSYESILGVKKENITGKLATEAYGVPSPPYLEEFSRPYNEGVNFYFETYFPPMKKHFSISVAKWGDRGFATIFTDITARKKHDEEREEMMKVTEDKNAELERFIYTVSHDLKNPLITINGFSGLLKKHLDAGKLNDAQTDADLIMNAAGMMDNQLKDLLEMSRIGRVANKPENIKVADITRDAVKLIQGELISKKVEISIDNELDDEYIYADKQRLTEVLQNLLSNAVKFMGAQKHPQVEIGVKNSYNGYERVYYIKDNGIGIEKQFLTRVFGLFDRLNPKIEGTGIGLAIVKRIIELHGGNIWAESDGPGKGSVFYFTVPEVKI